MGDSSLAIRIEQVLSYTFLIFAAGCTFSIAVAQAALAVSILLFVTLMLVKRRALLADSPRDLYFALGLLIVWAFVTGLLRSNFKTGLAEIEGYWTMLALPVGWYLLQSERYRTRVIRVLGLLILLGGIAGLLQFFTGVKWPGVASPVPSSNWGYRAQGFFSSRMTYAQVFVPFVLFLFYLGCAELKQRKRTAFTPIFLGAGILGTVGVMLALSRSAMVALVIGMLLIGFMLGRKQLGLIFLGLVLGGLISWLAVPDFALRLENTTLIDLRDYKVAGRQFIWARSFEIFIDHPVIGVGKSGFKEEYIARLPAEFNDDRIPGDAHSDWLQMGVTTGLPGVILLATLWLVILKRTARKMKAAQPLEQNLARAGLIAILGILIMSLPVSLFEDSEMVHAMVLIWLITLTPLKAREQ